MRIMLDATDRELQTKAPDLVKALAGTIRPANPELADCLENSLLGGDSLEKALSLGKESPLKFPVLRALHEQEKQKYQDQLQAMLDEVAGVLGSAVVQKSLEGESGEPGDDSLEKSGLYIGPRGGRWADAKHTIPYKEEKPAKPKQLDLFAAGQRPTSGAAQQLLKRVVDKDATKKSWIAMSAALDDLHEKLRKWHDGFDVKLSRKKLVAQLDALEAEFQAKIPAPRIEMVGGLSVETVDTTVEQQASDVGVQGIAWRKARLVDRDKRGRHEFSMQYMRADPAMWSGLYRQKQGRDTVYMQGRGFTAHREADTSWPAGQAQERREKNWGEWEQGWRKEIAKQLADVVQLPREHHQLLARAQVRTRFAVHKSVDNLQSCNTTAEATVDPTLKRELITIMSLVRDPERGENGVTLTHEVGHIVDFIVHRSSQGDEKLTAVLDGQVDQTSDAAQRRIYVPNERARNWMTNRIEWVAEAYRYVYRDGGDMRTTLQHTDFDMAGFRKEVDNAIHRVLDTGVVLPSREMGGKVLNLPLPDPEALREIARGETDAEVQKAMFIGPRGGKWADAKHTIPYKEEKPASKVKGDAIQVKIHPKIGGGGDLDFHILKVEGGKVTISRHADSQFGVTMPRESLKHFVNDLAGRVVLPPAGNPDIDAVTQGKAVFLGKGDDGLAFRVENKVVKVSTTVPYHPENPGHRTPAQAKAMLRAQVEVGNTLADKGVAGVQRSEYIEHGDKGFQLKEYVEIPEKFTRRQLDTLQDTLIEIHKAGYAVHDTIQAGIELLSGKLVMFDVGKADKITKGEDPAGIYSSVTSDMDNMKLLYQEHGQEFVRRDYSAGQHFMDRAEKLFLDKVHENPGFVHNFAGKALAKRATELKATLSGKELDAALDDLDHEWAFGRMDLEDAGLTLPVFGPKELANQETTKSLEKAGPDYTEQVAKQDQARYDQLRTALKRKGYTDADFDDKDGRLYGQSANQLVDLIDAAD